MTEVSVQPNVTSPAQGGRIVFDRNERVLLGLLACMVILCVGLSVLKEQAVAWGAFGLSVFPAMGLLAAGIYIRRKKNQPNLAHLAIGNSLYLGFTGAATVLIYLRFPVTTGLFDQQLMRMDSALGYSWPDFVETVATYPEFARILGLVYHSSLPQLFALIAFLALTGRILKLHRALLAGSLGLLLTTLIWWLAPSIGPSAFHNIPTETAEAMNLVTNMQYGAYLRQLLDHGLPVISPNDIVGTIAFPSYHTVMALLMIWYLRGTVLFLPALALNLAMVPAILSHGGHYLTDMAGGIATFAIAAWLAGKLATDPRPATR
ncbi:MAG: phosphatase PAP2 family protein [Ruegeria sp.]|uniref:phosphatase PAP2 family protein n=1 Tax=Ruegeria sp. TaxID=1879320 RepID=UPI00349EF9E4